MFSIMIPALWLYMLTVFSFASSHCSVFFFSRNLFPDSVFSKKGLEELCPLAPSGFLQLKDISVSKLENLLPCIYRIGIHLTRQVGLCVSKITFSSRNNIYRAVHLKWKWTAQKKHGSGFERCWFILFREIFPCVLHFASTSRDEKVRIWLGLAALISPQLQAAHITSVSICGPFHSKRCKFCFIKW